MMEVNGFYYSFAAYNNYDEEGNGKGYLDTSDSLYVIISKSSAEGYWLSSVASMFDYGGCVYVTSGGNVGGDNYWDYYLDRLGIRPIICLKSSVQLVDNGDGTYNLSL